MEADANGVHDLQLIFPEQPWDLAFQPAPLQPESYAWQQVRRISSNVPIDMTDTDIHVDIPAGGCQPGSYPLKL